MNLKQSLLCLMSLVLVCCGEPEPFRRGPEQKSDSPAPSGTSKPTAPAETSQPGTQNPDPVIPIPPVLELDAVEFEKSVLPLFEKKCGLCHQNPAPNFEKAKASVVFQSLEKSELYLYATGKNGRHRTIFKPGTPEILILGNWIMGIQVR